jgi:hypothetical protein
MPKITPAVIAVSAQHIRTQPPAERHNRAVIRPAALRPDSTMRISESTGHHVGDRNRALPRWRRQGAERRSDHLADVNTSTVGSHVRHCIAASRHQLCRSTCRRLGVVPTRPSAVQRTVQHVDVELCELLITSSGDRPDECEPDGQ